MALRLSPAHPLVWRTPDEVQFGVEAPVLRLRRLDDRQHFLLGLLKKGVSRPVLDALAAERRIPPAVVDDLLAAVTPVLERGSLPGQALEGLVVGVEGRGPAVPAIEQLLQRVGALPLVGVWPAPPDLGVLVSQYATVPRRSATWLCDDVPHLVVEFGDRSLRIGPMVVPGSSPCASCLEFERAEVDAGWPAIASQLVSRLAPTADAVAASIAAGLVVSALLDHRACQARGSPSGWQSSVLRVHGIGPGSASGSGFGAPEPLTMTTEPVSPHPRCGCRSLPGSARAPDRLLAGFPRPPTTASGAPVPG